MLASMNRNNDSPVQKIRDHQKQRINDLYHPMQQITRSNHNHHNPQGLTTHIAPHGSVNRRNKYDRVNEVRQRHRMESVNLKRERLDEQQKSKDASILLQKESNDLSVDIEQLLEEERELEMIRQQQAELEEMEKYQQELEEYFADMDISK